jgi:hypothetical protein
MAKHSELDIVLLYQDLELTTYARNQIMRKNSLSYPFPHRQFAPDFHHAERVWTFLASSKSPDPFTCQATVYFRRWHKDGSCL